MWHIYRKMYSLRKALGKDYIEKEKDRLCKGQGPEP